MPEKKKTTAITKPKTEAVIPLTKETIRKYVSDKATDQEIMLFLNQCKMFNLNPFKREIYLIKYSEKTPAQFVVSYDVYLKRMEATKNLNGWEWGTEGDPKVPSDECKAWIRIWRKDWDKPLYHEVFFEEYAQYKTDYHSGKKVLTKFWFEKPKTMIKKVVLSQAARLCFPSDLGSLPYTAEEMPVEHAELPTEEIKEAEIVEEKPTRKITANGKKKKEEPKEEKKEEPEEEPSPEEPKEKEPEEPGKGDPKKMTEEEMVEYYKQKVLADFEIRYGPKKKETAFKSFKKFLLDFQKTRKPERKFVGINEFGHISMSEGAGKDVKIMWDNFVWVLGMWGEWEKAQLEAEEEMGEEKIPF